MENVEMADVDVFISFLKSESGSSQVISAGKRTPKEAAGISRKIMMSVSYKLPDLRYLMIEVVDASPHTMTFLRSISSNRMKEKLVGQCVSLEPVSKIHFQLTDKHALHFKIISYRTDGVSSWGKIGLSTQIVIKSDPLCGHSYVSTKFGTPFHPSTSIHADNMWKLYDSYLLSRCVNLARFALFPSESALNSTTTTTTPARSILLVGESGTGLTTIAYGVAKSVDIPLIVVSTASLFSNCVGVGYDKLLQNAFNCAVAVQPCILLIDDVECLCASSARCLEGENNVNSLFSEVLEMNLKKLAQFSTSGNLKQVFVIGCCRAVCGDTTRIKAEDAGIRPNAFKAFESVVAVPLPTVSQRCNIIRHCVDQFIAIDTGGSSSSSMSQLHQIDFNAWAEQLVGLPTAALCSTVESILTKFILLEEPVDADRTSLVAASNEALLSFQSAVKGCYFLNHGGFRNLISHPPLVGEQSLGLQIESHRGLYGHKTQLQSITECVIWPRKYAHVYRAFHINPEIGVLLFGPPGTGKTFLPGAVAAVLKSPLIVLRLSDVVRGTIGTGEQAVRDVFAEAKRRAPSIIFIDEFQAIFTARHHENSNSSSSNSGSAVGALLTATLMTCFDDIESWNRHSGCESHISVIAATNEPWAIDSSFLRQGRFGRLLYVGKLDLEARTELLVDWYMEQKERSAAFLLESLATATEPFTAQPEESMTTAEIEWIAAVAALSKDYSAADMQLLIQRACLAALNDGVSLPTYEHFQSILATMKPTITDAEEREYQNWLATMRK